VEIIVIMDDPVQEVIHHDGTHTPVRMRMSTFVHKDAGYTFQSFCGICAGVGQQRAHHREHGVGQQQDAGGPSFGTFEYNIWL
jgi:hypothetical protein